ncbi:DUF488 family protein [Gordonia shandongensis]|uniref:DUF488 domain-containing protein n=1 Tax=Gordonia shandongensis TaxID=376351 RepID=UPI000687E865|nr:DUF488 domain-containing protein [Gordonia shandongensis]
MTGSNTGPGPTLWTVGHSTRSADEFVALLAEHGIELVEDVRRLPGSSRFPQFDADTLRRTLAAADVDLHREAALTGRRPVSKDVPFEVNAWWRNRSFHNYADHALSAEFREALAAVAERALRQRTAIMCAEAVWWRCHRRIIADHLLAAGHRVVHVTGPGQSTDAELSAGARVDDGALVYPETVYPETVYPETP